MPALAEIAVGVPLGSTFQERASSGTMSNEELTPTMKLKRKFVNEKYKELIESMYSDAA